jgi:hypothetical protein
MDFMNCEMNSYNEQDTAEIKNTKWVEDLVFAVVVGTRGRSRAYMSMPLVHRNFQTPHSPHCFEKRQATGLVVCALHFSRNELV